MTYIFTREQLEAVRQRLLKDNGVTLSGDDGTVEHSGVLVSYDYKEPVLKIEIIHKPRLLSQGFVEGKINAWFRSVENAGV